MKRKRTVWKTPLHLEEGEAAIIFKPDGRHRLVLPDLKPCERPNWANFATWLFARLCADDEAWFNDIRDWAEAHMEKFTKRLGKPDIIPSYPEDHTVQ